MVLRGAGAVNVVRLGRVHVLDQLRLEEALLRAHSGNWLVMGRGSPALRAVVMGISGVAEELTYPHYLKANDVTLIKRFTGGGTVYVDKDTLFVGLIFNHEALINVKPFPRPIMEWSAKVYDKVFNRVGRTDQDFRLNEHDYCFGHRKFGGNAQALVKERWIHHTSFLWDYDIDALSNCLKMPKKRPEYRESREHKEFLVNIKAQFPELQDPEVIFDNIEETLKNDCSFEIKRASETEIQEVLQTPHRQGTVVLDEY